MKRIPIGHFPYRETIASALGVGLFSLLIYGLPPYLPPSDRLHPYDLMMVGGWLTIRLFGVWAGVARWRKWHLNPLWCFGAARLQRQARGEAVLIGKGFAWTPGHTEALRRYRRERGDYPLLADGAVGTPALHGVGYEGEGRIAIPQDRFTGHMSIQATTGAGKSVLLTSLAVQAIYRKAGAVVIIDPKGDDYFIAHVIQAAQAAGRKLAIFAPYFRELSCKFNPLSTCTLPEEIIARLRPLFDRTDNDFFIVRPLSILLLMARLQRLLGRPWTLQDLYADVMIPMRRVERVVAYLASIGVPVAYRGASPQGVEHVIVAYEKHSTRDHLADACIKLLHTHVDFFEQTMTNLDTAVMGLVGSDYSDLLTHEGALTWQDIDRERMVVLVLTTSMLLGQIGNKIGRLVLQDLMGYFGHRKTTGASAYEPLTLLIDEAGQVAYPELTTQVAQARDCNGRFIAAWQSWSSIVHAMGEHPAQELADNFNLKIYGRTTDSQTQERVSKDFGACEIAQTATRVSRQFGGDGESGNSITSSRDLRDKSLIEASWLSKLPNGHVLMRDGGVAYKVQVPYLGPADVKRVESEGYGNLIHTLRVQQKKDGPAHEA